MTSNLLFFNRFFSTTFVEMKNTLALLAVLFSKLSIELEPLDRKSMFRILFILFLRKTVQINFVNAQVMSSLRSILRSKLSVSKSSVLTIFSDLKVHEM